MTAKFGVTDKLVLREIDSWNRYLLVYWRAMIPTGVTAAMVVPILRRAKDVVEMLLTDHAKGVEHLMFKRLNHPLYKRLEVR